MESQHPTHVSGKRGLPLEPRKVSSPHTPSTAGKSVLALINCPYDSGCTSTSLDLPGSVSHAVYTHKTKDFRCPFCPFITSDASVLTNHGIMKHGFYPRATPACRGLPFTKVSSSQPEIKREAVDPSHFHPIMSIFAHSPRSTSFRPSLNYVADRHHARSRRSHRLHSHRDGHLDRRKHRRSLSKDSSNTLSPSPEPSVSLSLQPAFEIPPMDYEVAAALYGPHPTMLEPYPMPDYAEDTVIFPLELPDFDL